MKKIRIKIKKYKILGLKDKVNKLRNLYIL